MRRLCERPGCGAPAEASYGIDSVQLTVWIDNRAILERELAGRLCRRHADALVVPRGWTVDDRREAIPKLFVVPEAPATGTRDSAHGERARRSTARRVEDDASLFDRETDASTPGDSHTSEQPVQVDEAVAEVGHRVSGDEETRAIPWSPRLMRHNETRDDDGDEEDAPVMGRLLGRAFGRSRDPRS